MLILSDLDKNFKWSTFSPILLTGIITLFASILYFSVCNQANTNLAIYNAQNIKRNTACFAIGHNTNALMVRLIARVGFVRQKHVCPVISLVTHLGWSFLIKMKQSLSRNLHGTLYVRMEFCYKCPFFQNQILKWCFQSNTTIVSFLYIQ